MNINKNESSIFDEITLQTLVRMSMFQLHDWLKVQVSPYGARAADRAMTILRNLQIALAKYSKGKEFDAVQDKMISVNAKIEKWIRGEYFRVKRIEIFRDRPDLIDKPEQVRQVLRENWEQYYTSRRY